MLRSWKRPLRRGARPTARSLIKRVQADPHKTRWPKARHRHAAVALPKWLEGARRRSRRLPDVRFADKACRPSIGSGLFGDALRACEELRARFEGARRDRPRRLAGPGELRELGATSPGATP